VHVALPCKGSSERQSVVEAKSPLVVMAVIASGVVILFVMGIAIGALAVFMVVLGKVTEATEACAGGRPEPNKLTVCVTSGALSVITRDPFCAPKATGANVKVMTQCPLAGKLAPQVLVCENEAPVVVMLVIVSAAVPVLVSPSKIEPLLPTKVGLNDWLVVPSVATWPCADTVITAQKRSAASTVAIRAQINLQFDFMEPRITF